MKNLLVGNLDSATTAASIRALFEPHGAVAHVKLMTDHDTGVSRGFAFVEMGDLDAVQAISALHGAVVDGRTLSVTEGRPKLHLPAEVRDRRVPRL